MARATIPSLVFLASLLGLVALAYPSVPQFDTTTYFSLSTATATASAFWVEYSNVNVTCASVGSVSCVQQMIPYSYTETWVLNTTEMQQVYSVTERHVPYAASLAGAFAVALIIVAISISGWILAKSQGAKSVKGGSHSFFFMPGRDSPQSAQ